MKPNEAMIKFLSERLQDEGEQIVVRHEVCVCVFVVYKIFLMKKGFSINFDMLLFSQAKLSQTSEERTL